MLEDRKENLSSYDKVNHVAKLNNLPLEIIYHIANYLEGKNSNNVNNFANFAITSKYFYENLISRDDLFCPKDNEIIVKNLENSSFEVLENIALKYARVRKEEKIDNLTMLASQYSDHEYTIPMDSLMYEIKMKNFDLELKFKLLLYFLGKNGIEDELKNLKEDKINAYFRTSQVIDKIPQINRLKMMQGAIISKEILQHFIKGRTDEQYQEFAKEILQKVNYYSFVNNFFQEIKAPIEDMMKI